MPNYVFGPLTRILGSLNITNAYRRCNNNNNNNNIYLFDLSLQSIEVTANYLVSLFSVVNILKSGHC